MPIRQVMKILLLNPSVDAGRKDVQLLREKGYIVLLACTATEAWQVLQAHGDSVALAVVHREGPGAQGEPGLHFIDKFRNDTEHSDLPFVLTTEKWQDSECAEHQQGPNGANAYLRSPIQPARLLEVVEGVIGPAESGDTSIRTPMPAGPAPHQVAPPPTFPKQTGEMVLEDASMHFSHAQANEPSDTSIKLEMPGETGSLSSPVALPVAESPPEIDVSAVVLPETPAGDEAAGIELGDDPLSIPTAMPGATSEPVDLDLHEADGEEEALIEAVPDDTGPSPAFETHDLAFERDLETEPEPRAEFDSEAYQAMPYVFGGVKARRGEGGPDPLAAFVQPLGDAVVPGGASESPDIETLKKYLLLREQDVAALTTQLKTARDQVRAQEEALRDEKARSAELEKEVDARDRLIEDFEREKAVALESLQREIGELRFQIKTRNDKAKVLATKLKDATGEIESLKDRVRSDIRKIRVREKELENRLEILRKDSEALIAAREGKIIELKRRLDLLEFNMDLVKDQYHREKETSSVLREKLARAAKAMRVAGGMLDADDAGGGDPSPDEAEKAS